MSGYENINLGGTAGVLLLSLETVGLGDESFFIWQNAFFIKENACKDCTAANM